MSKYARFYALLHQLGADWSDDYKESIVYQYTNRRTTHVSQATPREYQAMCNRLADILRQHQIQRRRSRRRACLAIMRDIGINTQSWADINAFTSSPRIAGKPFAQLTAEQLAQLQHKLYAIQRHGGIRPQNPPTQ